MNTFNAIFNGRYEAGSTEDEFLSQAHLDVLELLRVIHTICTSRAISYSLVNGALLRHVYKKAFADAAPNICVALKYADFQILRRELKQIAQQDHAFIVADAENSKQFDSFSLWFSKRNRVKLPDKRQKDEIYYYVRVEIAPVFFAGDTEAEFTRAKRRCVLAMKALNSRAPLPQRMLHTKIRIMKKILTDWYYRKKRDEVDIRRVAHELGQAKESALCFYPGSIESGVVKLTRQEIEDTIEIDFAGQRCLVSRYADHIAARYSREYKDDVLKYRVSDLIRKGGETLRRVQLIQTELLVEFDRICRKHGIRYNIAFGTLLGAVRHKGFIPWDDDVDVLAPYEDYVKLDAAMQEDLDTSRFFWRTIDTETDYNLTFKHLKRNGTVFMKPGRDAFKFHKGVLIDVFPVFHSANNRLTHWLQTKLCFFYRTATWAYMGADSESHIVKRLIYKAMRRAGVRKNYETFIKYATAPKIRNRYYSYFNATFRSPYHIGYLSEEAFDDPIEMEFEGHKFLAPRDYDSALAYAYGADYMLYPETENRIPSHFAIIDLDREVNQG